MQLLSRISSASISARRTTGRRRARAATSSGLSLDRRGHHDDIGAVDILGGVADRDRNALVAQPFDIGAFGDIGAHHPVAEIGQHLGNAAHADAANADEMDRPDVARQFHG
jgi:hypothetical protein